MSLLRTLSLILMLNILYAHQPLKFLEEMKGRADAAEKIYQVYCINCHDKQAKIPIGAPRTGVAEDWSTRLKNKETLVQHTLLGYQLMPARGGCFECSDEQLVQVIEYMTKSNIK